MWIVKVPMSNESKGKAGETIENVSSEIPTSSGRTQRYWETICSRRNTKNENWLNCKQTAQINAV